MGKDPVELLPSQGAIQILIFMTEYGVILGHQTQWELGSKLQK